MTYPKSAASARASSSVMVPMCCRSCGRTEAPQRWAVYCARRAAADRALSAAETK
jgi:hypothetical protein